MNEIGKKEILELIKNSGLTLTSEMCNPGGRELIFDNVHRVQLFDFSYDEDYETLELFFEKLHNNKN